MTILYYVILYYTIPTGAHRTAPPRRDRGGRAAAVEHSRTGGSGEAGPPMKSEPPTPTRAPDNQFRQIYSHLNHIRNTSLLNFWGRTGGSGEAGPPME